MNNSKTTVLVLTAVFLLSGSLALFADTGEDLPPHDCVRQLYDDFQEHRL